MYIPYKRCAVLSTPPMPNDFSELGFRSANKIMSDLGVPMLREIQRFDVSEKTEFYFIIKDVPDALEDLKPKVRNLVRRSFNNADIKKVTFNEIIEQGGYDVYIKSYVKYKDHTLFSLPSYESYVNNITKHKERDYWGVYDRETGSLIAYAVNICYENGAVEYGSLKCIPSFLKTHFPYYGLIFKMNEFYLSCGGV